MKPGSVSNVVCVVTALALLAVPAWAVGKNDMHVDNGIVKRGSSEYTIRSIYVPDLARPGASITEVTRGLNRAADVGAPAPCFDLYGVSESGRDIANDAAAAVRRIREIGEGRNMIGVIRVFGPYAPKSARARIQAAKTIAKEFRNDREFVYLLEGPDAERLAREFHRRAPGLLLVSPAGGDVQIVSEPAAGSERPTLLLGVLPPALTNQAHFILPQYDEYYELLDFACVEPAENHPWTPDNSILTPEEVADGWIALFDGKSLNGWTVLGENQTAWQIRNGILERATGGSQGLRTIDRYGNFILRWEWTLPNGGNNGVHLRAPRAARASRIGMEYQMLGDYGKEPDKNSTGSIYDVEPPTVNAIKPNGEWNVSEVTLNGSQLQYVLNGVTVQDRNIDEHDELKLRLRRGFIVLTEHNDPVMYRNIRIKPLPTPVEQIAVPARW